MLESKHANPGLRAIVADPHLFNADPDLGPAFHSSADRDPSFHFHADPDLDPTPYESDTNLPPLV